MPNNTTDRPRSHALYFSVMVVTSLAKSLGLDVPPMLLALADEVIE
jgi:hypothetical protein